MPIAVTDRVIRGESGASPFAVAWEEDLKISSVTVDLLTDRDSIPDWKRLPYMTCYVIEEDKTYRLGEDATTAGQSWTEIEDVTLPDNLVLEEDLFNDAGFIKPQLIGNIFLNDSFVVADETEMLALTTVTGNFVIREDTGAVYVKLNNDDPAALDDFAELTYPGSVLSVNGDTGVVVVTLADLIADDLSGFADAVAATSSVTTLISDLNAAESDIGTIESTLLLKADLVDGLVPVEQLPYDFVNGLNGSTSIGLGGNLISHTTIDGDDTYSLSLISLTYFITLAEAYSFGYNDGSNVYTLVANDENGFKYGTPPLSLTNYSLVYKQYTDQNVLGSTLSDPGEDAILFWDDSAGAVTWLTIGTGLSISGTSISAPGGGGTGVTIGSVTEIPFSNETEDDFEYDADFIYDSNTQELSIPNLSITSSPTNDNSLEQILVRHSSGEIRYRTITRGTAGKIPFMNSEGTDFSYSSGFLNWNETRKSLFIGTNHAIAAPTVGNSLVVGNNITSNVGPNWGIWAGDGHVLSVAGFGDNIIAAGWQQNHSGAGMGGSALFCIQGVTAGMGGKQGFLMAGHSNTINTGSGTSFANTIVGYQNQIVSTGSVTAALVSGRRSLATADGALVHGYPISNQSTRPIIASGVNAINMSANSSSQGSGHGVLANYSGMFAGQDGNIPSDSTHSVIIGGNGIKARANAPDQVYVPNFNIVTQPLNDDDLTQILVRDNTSGEIKYRTANSLFVGWLLEGESVLTDDTTIDSGSFQLLFKNESNSGDVPLHIQNEHENGDSLIRFLDELGTLKTGFGYQNGLDRAIISGSAPLVVTVNDVTFEGIVTFEDDVIFEGDINMDGDETYEIFYTDLLKFRSRTRAGTIVTRLDLDPTTSGSITLNTTDSSDGSAATISVTGGKNINFVSTDGLDLALMSLAPDTGLTLLGDLNMGDSNAIYLGDPTTNNTWRFIRNGNDLVIQRRESGSYVTKSTIGGGWAVEGETTLTDDTIIDINAYSLLFKNTSNSGDVPLQVQNEHANGFSAISFLDETGVLQGRIGYLNDTDRFVISTTNIEFDVSALTGFLDVVSVSTSVFTYLDSSDDITSSSLLLQPDIMSLTSDEITFNGGTSLNFSSPLNYFEGDVILTDSTNAFYLGEEDTDGTWRFIRNGSDLVIQRREAGSYVTKSTVAA